ncbi:MAG: Hsp33 family molecular chaperone HslO [Lachnospiraceae bacterium]|nr:Hsp33 family molecular chaperone HslO [Lachnospiraceae bacterium]
MNDYIVRATAAGASIRVFAATTRGVVEEARRAHNTSPVATAALGRLLTAGAMMGSMMKGEQDILTLKVEGNGPLGGIVVTADSSADVKGYVYNPEVLLHANEKGKLDVAGAVGIGVLSVIKDIGMREPYVGQTVLTTSEIAEDLTYYFATSEQIPSSVALGVLMNRDNTVRRAGGFIIQILPGAPEGIICELEERLKTLPPVTSLLDEDMTPEMILVRLFEGEELVITDRIRARFFCNCEKGRVERALVSVGEEALHEMIEAGEPIELKCHFCSRAYTFSVEELKEILRRSGRTVR